MIDPAGSGAQPSPRNPAPRWVGPVFLLFALALIPWIIYLIISLPSRSISHHYNLSWGGFDVLLVLAMGRTAFMAFKGRRQIELPAVATATLLVVDAWFDITTARPGWPQHEAILLAIFVELPTAALAWYIAWRVERVDDDYPPRRRRQLWTWKGVKSKSAGPSVSSRRSTSSSTRHP